MSAHKHTPGPWHSSRSVRRSRHFMKAVVLSPRKFREFGEGASCTQTTFKHDSQNIFEHIKILYRITGPDGMVATVIPINSLAKAPDKHRDRSLLTNKPGNLPAQTSGESVKTGLDLYSGRQKGITYFIYQPIQIAMNDADGRIAHHYLLHDGQHPSNPSRKKRYLTRQHFSDNFGGFFPERFRHQILLQCDFRCLTRSTPSQYCHSNSRYPNSRGGNSTPCWPVRCAGRTQPPTLTHAIQHAHSLIPLWIGRHSAMRARARAARPQEASDA